MTALIMKELPFKQATIVLILDPVFEVPATASK